jgi:hypothetical protein
MATDNVLAALDALAELEPPIALKDAARTIAAIGPLLGAPPKKPHANGKAAPKQRPASATGHANNHPAANGAAGAPLKVPPMMGTRVQVACEWLRHELQHGAIPQEDLRQRATSRHISSTAFGLARRQLGVRETKVGTESGAVAAWKLPA